MIVTKDERGGWVIVIQPDNLARMKQGDPATIPSLNLTICYEDLPQEKLTALLKSEGLAYLRRGWADHPDDYQDWKVVAQGKRKV